MLVRPHVLAGLLAGETYAQIAARLFITDKTVSTHVSHVLRKTGTSSRVELADFVRRGQDGRSGAEGGAATTGPTSQGVGEAFSGE
ncbi:hypothetical protein N798_14850 [Knoellia flava TL1]|uniref:HTH luxR-type domain-containing protein n=2 Tax=Knoellia flava TaxID=913969 RepID=A0A8H9FPE9_9MICO|nr:helix-turn-helix transcriptional regulator [Knoellia flava]KGN29329.1 hypothetical protein N798_14850 [Knoellia flava TL1]GGB67147.1 hypothetical protein GCM10011314_02940 [Knoellia flava]